MTTAEIEAKVEELDARKFRHRFSQTTSHHVGWQSVYPGRGEKYRGFVRARLMEGCEVATGYYATAVRGFHAYCVFWKPGKGGPQCRHDFGNATEACRKCGGPFLMPPPSV